jgi:tetratricopeptide (TPR) repeat protein
MNRAWLVAVVAIAGTARADVWEQAADPDLQRDKYARELDAANDFLFQATGQNIVDTRVASLLDKAIASYRRAAELEPSEGEPLYDLGEAIYGFYLVCYEDQRAVTPLCTHTRPLPVARAEQALAAWAEFEKRAPLDPRNSVADDPGQSLLATRALLETRLATKPHLEAASHLYEKILARGEVGYASEQIVGNLAETYMMLDRLDDAIAMYRGAVGQDPSTGYGLAVALDRDGHGEEALEVARDQGPPGGYLSKLQSGAVFYVPDGEQYYYRALIDESFGDLDESIAFWEQYIQSGAHPEFQPRARQHLDALRMQLKKHPKRPSKWPDSEPSF